MSIALALMAICFATDSAHGRLSCLDEDGNSVDWFMAYKFPRLWNSSDSLFKTGHAYAFFTSEDVKSSEEPEVASVKAQDNDDTKTQMFLYRFKELLYDFIGNPLGLKKPKRKLSQLDRPKSPKKKFLEDNPNWTISKLLVSNPDSAVMRTLSVAYDKDIKSINGIFYNDDPPKLEGENKTRNSFRAHAKGVLLLDEESGDGVWLTHSVPNFPPNRDQKLQFFDNSVKFGQTFMCVSFDLHKFGNQIVEHLANMRPLVYEHSISDTMYRMIPDLRDLSHEKNSKFKKVRNVPKLSQLVATKEGQVLHLFSKSNSYKDDLYSGWIDTEIGSSLYAETWRRGAGGNLNSNCSEPDYHVNNVKDLKYDKSTKWSYLRDHSKWAITDEKDKGFVCIADINRMPSQFKRGGGAVCMKCPTCWSVFSNTIDDVEPCPAPDQKPKKESKVDLSFLNKLRGIFGRH